MKITKKILENIIKEEIAKLIKEEGYMPGAGEPGAIAHKSLDDLENDDKMLVDVYAAIRELDDAMSEEIERTYSALSSLGWRPGK